jgi:hypothetical protein
VTTSFSYEASVCVHCDETIYRVYSIAWSEWFHLDFLIIEDDFGFRNQCPDRHTKARAVVG